MTFLDNYADHLLFLLSAAMIFLPLEHILPRVKREKFIRESLSLDLLYMLLGALMIMILAGLYISLVVSLLESDSKLPRVISCSCDSACEELD